MELLQPQHITLLIGLIPLFVVAGVFKHCLDTQSEGSAFFFGIVFIIVIFLYIFRVVTLVG